MKAITLITMMEQEEYQALTCKEFAKIVRTSGVLDKEFAEELIMPEFLEGNWKPESVTMHTNKDKS